MKIVLAGGTGQVGRMLARAFCRAGDEVVVLSRALSGNVPHGRLVHWDAETVGSWAIELDGADAVIGLAGRSVNCRYHEENRRAIRESRVQSVHAIGRAIQASRRPPAVWMQASTATIYRHTLGEANDECNGVIGEVDGQVPEKWKFSIDVATAWEQALESFGELAGTRTVLLRSAMTMSPDRGGVFDTFRRLVRLGLGGTIGNGNQFVSWVHEEDFVASVRWILDQPDLAGAVNICSPTPLPNGDFMRTLRVASSVPIGLPAAGLILEIGAWLMQTESELVLKSRRVVPTRLLESGFRFAYPQWREAAFELCKRSCARWP